MAGCYGRLTRPNSLAWCRIFSASAARPSCMKICLSCRSAAVRLRAAKCRRASSTRSPATAAASSLSTSSPAKSSTSSTDELASYSSPKLATIDGRRMVFCIRPRRACRLRAHARQARFSISLAGTDSWKASTPATRWSTAIECLFPNAMALGARCSKCAGQVRAGVDRRSAAAATRRMQDPLEHADLPRRLSLRIERPARRRSRAALHRTGHRQSAVERTGIAPRLAAGCRRAFHLPERGRHATADQGGSRQVRAGEHRSAQVAERGQRRREWPAAVAAPAWAAPVLSHGLLYVRGADRLVALEAIPAH